jgi:16S rRNA G966 N2-methylase RsmD
LEPGACLIIEHSALEPIPEIKMPLKLNDQRRYGKTLVSFLNYVL